MASPWLSYSWRWNHHGASCKGVILRRPRGDASLLGHNSTVLWWCLILRIRIVKSWGLKWFGNLCVNVYYLCLTLKLHVDCYDIRFLYISLSFCLRVCCVWLSLLRWSSILLMWADVRIPNSGNDSRDATTWWLDGFGAHYGAYRWRRPNNLWFPCLGQDLVLPLELLHFVLRSVVPFSFVMDMFGALCNFISQTSYSLNIHVCDW